MPDPIKIRPALALTGGTAGALDSFASASIVDNEPAFTFENGIVYLHQYDSASALAESSPLVIAPDDIGAGNGRWILISALNQSVVSGASPTFDGTNFSGINHAALSSNLAFTSSGHTGTATHIPFFDSLGAASSSANFTYDSATGIFSITYVNTTETANPAGDLKIQPDATGNVVLFGDTDVGDEENGKKLYIYRKAAEGDVNWDLNIDRWKICNFNATEDIAINPASGKNLHLQMQATGNVHYFYNTGNGENAVVYQYGYITAAASKKYISWQVSDTDDYFHLTRQDANILGFKCDMPLQVAGQITATELSADPADPAEGSHTIWQSDGTGAGDDGDIMMKITAGGVTKTVTIVDFSAV